MRVLVPTDEVRQRSTAAARDYVRVVVERLQMEIKRHGDHVLDSRSCQALERSISPAELARMWPHADVDEALAEAEPVRALLGDVSR
jgi:hypothetical protein